MKTKPAELGIRDPYSPDVRTTRCRKWNCWKAQKENIGEALVGLGVTERQVRTGR